MGALIFPALPEGVWTVEGGQFEIACSPTFPDKTYGEISVADGTLLLKTPIATTLDGVVKRGDGELRLEGLNNHKGKTVLDAGVLSLSGETMLAVSPIIFRSNSASLTLLGSAQIGGLETTPLIAPQIDLGGHTLTIGGEYSATRIFDGRLKNGEVIFARGSAHTFSAEQEVESVRIENSTLTLGIGTRVVGWWRFEDVAEVGLDSGPEANHLVQVGGQAQWLTNDPERGSVLALEGTGAYLAAPGLEGSLSALPASNTPFTVAMWLKPSPSVDDRASIYAWGQTLDNHYNMMRLNTPSSNAPLLQTNWDNNKEIAYAGGLVDGAWHHVAIVYHGNYTCYYINGVEVDARAHAPPLFVPAINFTLGKGSSPDSYKGLLDDVLITQGALSQQQIEELRLNSTLPAAVPPANLLPTTSSVELEYNARLCLASDQTVAQLSGAGGVAQVELKQGATLTVSAGGNVKAAISGEGELRKEGSESTLTLGGRVDAPVTIAAGTLALADRLPRVLVAYYRFDDPTELGKDSSGNGYHLTPFNAPTTGSGVYGGAVELTAASQQYLAATHFPAKLPTGDQSYTMAVWCNLKEGGNYKGMPIYWGAGATTASRSALFRFEAVDKIMTTNMRNNWEVKNAYNLAVDTPDGGWHHIVCTYDSETQVRKVFFNGIETATDTTTALNIQGVEFWLGGAPYGSANYFDGLLDEAMIFDRALDADEIAEIMMGAFAEAGSERLQSRVVARYDFEDANNLGKDTGPYGYHLESVGAVGSRLEGRGRALLFSSSKYGLGYLRWPGVEFPEKVPVGNAAVTITAWVNPVSAIPANDTSIVFWGTPASKQCHLLRMADNAGDYTTFRLVDGSGATLSADQVITLDRGDAAEGWHHVAAVVGPGGLRSLYIDGVRAAYNRVSGMAVTAQNLEIGHKTNAANNWFRGRIDDVVIYDCALTHAEILESLRERPDILPPEREIEIPVGTTLDVGNAQQRTVGLQGAGNLHIACHGVLSVSGGAGAQFSGTLQGVGELKICDAAAQSFSGTGDFSGRVVVTNAALIIENEVGTLTGSEATIEVQHGGEIGGGGQISGTLRLADGAAVVACTKGVALRVNGVAEVANGGVVILPPDVQEGHFKLIEANALHLPEGLDAWEVVPAVPVGVTPRFVVDERTLSLRMWRDGTLFIVK